MEYTEMVDKVKALAAQNRAAKTEEEKAEQDLEEVLPFYMWYPYEISSWERYWCTYCQQLHSAFVATLCAIGVDTLLNAILSQICMHLDALAKRIEELDAELHNEEELFKIIQHHDLVLRYSQLLI